jgi:tetratricopeptide (TPR) repeat protein
MPTFMLSLSRASSLRLAMAAATTAVLVALAPAASADEIRLYDPATCEVKTEKGEVVDESWTVVAWKTSPTQPLKKAETRLVLDIKRTTDDPQAAKLRTAIDDLARGQFGPAREALTGVAGGGLSRNPDTDRVEFKPFPLEQGAAKAKWYVGYAHFFWAKAALLEGKEKNDKSLVEAALRALDADQKDEKGFLARFKEGKSRWYADAMGLKAEALLLLGRHDEAAAAWDALYQKSIQLPIGPRFAYESKLGPGRIAEAKGDATGAEGAYETAASALQSLLDQAPDACAQRELGRYWAEARVQKARVMLRGAERADSPPEYSRLRAFLEQGSPESIKARLAGKKPEVIDAMVAGAQAPTVQAVVQNGIGLAYFSEKKYVDALFAFAEVRIKHFAVRDEVPRALWHLAKAADAAGAAATGKEAKALFAGQADAARKELERSFKGWTPTKGRGPETRK